MINYLSCVKIRDARNLLIRSSLQTSEVFLFSSVRHCEIVSAVCINIIHLWIVSIWVGGEVIWGMKVSSSKGNFKCFKTLCGKILTLSQRACNMSGIFCFENWKECTRHCTLRNFSCWWWLHQVVVTVVRKVGVGQLMMWCYFRRNII